METYQLAFIISIVLLLFLLWRFFFKVQLFFNPQILGEKTPEEFGMVYPERYQKMLRLGLEKARKSRVVFCALIRDGEEQIPTIIKNFERFNGYFKDWKLLIVENDSKDKTRELLLDWARRNKKVTVLGCGVNVKSCTLNLPKTEAHEISRGRIDKMSIIRNIYLDYIKKNLADWDFMVVQDVDLEGKMYIDGFFNSLGFLFSDNSIDMLGANGVLKLPGGIYVPYDSYASTGLKETGVYSTNRWLSHAIKRKLEHLNMSPGEDLEPVDSCFGGTAIYRLSSIIKSGFNYDLNKTDDVKCEHVIANMYLKKKYMNPSLVVLCLKNDNA